MNKVLFSPYGHTIHWATLDDKFSEEEIRHSTQLFMADWDFAMEQGGDFVRAFLSKINVELPKGYNWVIDSKVHMLKPGWYPGIPGWHIDFAPGWENIVDFTQVDKNEIHFCAISHEHSRTEFLAAPVELNVLQVPKINGLLSKQVEALYPHLHTIKALPNQIWRITQLSLHRVTPATSPGWRMFVRASITKLRQPRNEIRTQASQIYILTKDEHSGW